MYTCTTGTMVIEWTDQLEVPIDRFVEEKRVECQVHSWDGLKETMGRETFGIMTSDAARVVQNHVQYGTECQANYCWACDYHLSFGTAAAKLWSCYGKTFQTQQVSYLRENQREG